MQVQDVEPCWRELTEEVITGMHEWRLQHLKATFREIETAPDEPLAQVRARMLEDAALTSRSTNPKTEDAQEELTCPECQTPLERQGEHTHTLVTQYDQPIHLRRTYAFCPPCKRPFPL